MLFMHVHISYSISKLGANIPSVNLPPVKTCRPDAPCANKCYARKGRFSWTKNKMLLERNLEIWENDPEQFERDVMIAAFSSRFFRWHSAGDIPNMDYLKMMVRVAEALPGTAFLVFTKKYELINAYIAEYGMPPKNLRIVLSAWDCFMPENPYHLPVAYIRFRFCECAIPHDAHKCPKYCGECVMTGMSCWDLDYGESVCFDEH